MAPFQSVKKVAERHFFEFYGFCLAKKHEVSPRETGRN